MSHHAGAFAAAEAQVAAVHDDPAARLAAMARVFRGPTGDAPRHLPFRRARFFMNVARLRVLYVRALAAAPRLALGRCAVLGRAARPRQCGRSPERNGLLER